MAGHLIGSLGTLDFVSRQGNPCRFYGVTLQATQVFDDWAEPTRLRKWVRCTANGFETFSMCAGAYCADPVGLVCGRAGATAAPTRACGDGGARCRDDDDAPCW